tara:strand:+ start:2247 stop:2870 length:624 start_codon:yes stop_codon:yes gene_type:complete
MPNKIMVEPDDSGNVIRVSKNNPVYGHVRLSQDVTAFGVNGWVKSSTRSTLIHGTVEDLETVGIADMKELSGNIIIREQTEPFSSTDPDRDLKIAGDTGIICCKDGEPIYRKTFYDATGLQVDDLVAHTNGDAIREAQSGGASKSMSPNLDFDSVADHAEKPKKKSKKKSKENESEAEVTPSPIDDVENQVEEPIEIDENSDESFEL